MKKVFLAALGIIITCSLFAQQSQSQKMSSVYITINGNKNLQVGIDGEIYGLTNSTTTVSKTNIPISNLEAGMHSLTFTRTANNNTRRANDIATEFNLRRNFDMYINVNANGSIELIEKKKGIPSSNNYTPMRSSDFNTLYKNVRSQYNTQNRNALLSTTFNNRSTYLTSLQVVQLLQQVRSESDRLPLARLSYRTVTDPNNFSSVYNLFNVQANRSDLEDFVNSYEEDVTIGTTTTTTTNTDSRTGMSEAYFTSLYQTIRGQSPVSTQVNSLSTAFNTSGNYFTSSQVSQLIQLVSSDVTRLQLAKSSYHAVVDPINFTKVSNLLYSQSSRDELMVYINNGGEVVPLRTVMSDADYNGIYQSVTSQFLPFAKMTQLTSIFNNAAYYFTASQAKNLIQLVSNESNRLQLAKSAYRNLVDRPNYIQFYDLFTSSISTTELNAYVQAYRD